MPGKVLPPPPKKKKPNLFDFVAVEMVLWGLFIYFYQQGSELPSQGDTKPSLAPMLLRIAVAVTGVDMNLADIFFLPFRCPYCFPEWCVHTGKKLLCSFTLEMWLVCRPQRAGTETCGVNVPILAQQQEEHRVGSLLWLCTGITWR